jgi:hypothetical protein
MSAHSADLPDPYAEVSVHGLWPLVVDPDAPGGLRFANLGADLPEDCLRSPDDLPEAEISIRTLVGSEARDAWIAAVAEFAGNGVVAVPGSYNHGNGVQPVLVMRFDRDRRAAATLEEAVPLLRDLEVYKNRDHRPEPSEIGRGWRSRYLERLAENARRDAFAASWKSERAVLHASKRVSDLSSPERADRLRFQFDPPFGVELRLGRIPTGVRVVLEARGMNELVGSHAAAWRIAAEARGWDASSPASPTLDLPVFDEGGLARVEDDVDTLLQSVKRLTRLSASWKIVAAACADAETLKMLRRLAMGLPVASTRQRDPAAQISPRTCAPVTVAGARVERAFLAGLIEPVFWRDRHPRNPRRAIPVATPFDMEGILWGLTATGRTLACTPASDDLIDEAAETQQADAERAEAWNAGRTPKLGRLPNPPAGPEIVTERFVVADPALREALGVLRSRFRLAFGFPRHAEDLACAGAAMAAGVMVVREDRLYPAETVAPSSAPRP